MHEGRALICGMSYDCVRKIWPTILVLGISASGCGPWLSTHVPKDINPLSVLSFHDQVNCICLEGWLTQRETTPVLVENLCL